MLRKENAEIKELLVRVQCNFRVEMSALGPSMQNAYRYECGSKIESLTSEIEGIKKDTKENKTRFDSFINAIWLRTKPYLNQPTSHGSQFNHSKSLYDMMHGAIQTIGMAN